MGQLIGVQLLNLTTKIEIE